MCSSSVVLIVIIPSCVFGIEVTCYYCIRDVAKLVEVGPVCERCGAALLTVHHIIVECQGLQRERRRRMETTKQREWNMKNLLSDGGKIHVVLEFLRMTNIFDHI